MYDEPCIVGAGVSVLASWAWGEGPELGWLVMVESYIYRQECLAT